MPRVRWPFAAARLAAREPADGTSRRRGRRRAGADGDGRRLRRGVVLRLQTFTTAIYRAWFSLGDRIAASQLASVLLGVVLVLTAFELRARGRARFVSAPNSARPAGRLRLRGGRGLVATLACCLPLAGGFFLPTAILIGLAAPAVREVDGGRYLQWLLHSVLLGGAAALIAVAVAVVLAYAVRLATRGVPAQAVALAARLMNLGYAVPGIVIAVGILLPLRPRQLDRRLDEGRLRRRHRAAVHRQRRGAAVRLPGALLRGGVPADRGGAGANHAGDGRQRAQPRREPARGLRPRARALLAPSLFAAALLVFVDVMKELPATLVLRPFNFDTLAVIAYQFAADERLGEAAIPSLTIVAVGVLPVILLSRAIATQFDAGAGRRLMARRA